MHYFLRDDRFGVVDGEEKNARLAESLLAEPCLMVLWPCNTCWRLDGPRESSAQWGRAVNEGRAETRESTPGWSPAGTTRALPWHKEITRSLCECGCICLSNRDPSEVLPLIQCLELGTEAVHCWESRKFPNVLSTALKPPVATWSISTGWMLCVVPDEHTVPVLTLFPTHWLKNPSPLSAQTSEAYKTNRLCAANKWQHQIKHVLLTSMLINLISQITPADKAAHLLLWRQILHQWGRDFSLFVDETCFIATSTTVTPHMKTNSTLH